MKHKHDEVIRAFLDGKDIQYTLDGEGWVTVNLSNFRDDGRLPMFSNDVEYRIAPEPLKYRVSLHKKEGEFYTLLSGTKQVELTREYLPTFVRWITDWVEVEI